MRKVLVGLSSVLLWVSIGIPLAPTAAASPPECATTYGVENIVLAETTPGSNWQYWAGTGVRDKTLLRARSTTSSCWGDQDGGGAALLLTSNSGFLNDVSNQLIRIDFVHNYNYNIGGSSWSEFWTTEVKFGHLSSSGQVVYANKCDMDGQGYGTRPCHYTSTPGQAAWIGFHWGNWCWYQFQRWNYDNGRNGISDDWHIMARCQTYTSQDGWVWVNGGGAWLDVTALLDTGWTAGVAAGWTWRVNVPSTSNPGMRDDHQELQSVCAACSSWSPWGGKHKYKDTSSAWQVCNDTQDSYRVILTSNNCCWRCSRGAELRVRRSSRKSSSDIGPDGSGTAKGRSKDRPSLLCPRRTIWEKRNSASRVIPSPRSRCRVLHDLAYDSGGTCLGSACGLRLRSLDTPGRLRRSARRRDRRGNPRASDRAPSSSRTQLRVATHRA
jgi:hypothetical protein